MTLLTYSHGLVAGTPENVNHVQEMFDDAKTIINGNLDTANLSTSADIAATQLASSVGEPAGLNQTGVTRRGKSIIATEQSRTNTAYGLLDTPDRVQNVVLPTDGLIVVLFHGMFNSSVASVGRAAIFLGSNQLKVADHTTGNRASVTQAAATNGAGDYNILSSAPIGLVGGDAAGAGMTGAVTTGQAVAYVGAGSVAARMSLNDAAAINPTNQIPGGLCYIFAAAGTYTISIQYKSSSGSVTVKERKLWVWTIGF